ncbi:MAG: hypothetical protein Q7U38_05835 [Methylobacter sp.]|nr:hypothetical protein [Methylobacter sp.]MDP2099572.1 hypothetical protein [Methylobacter sp.]MDP2430281.1 hypothetical protein [Methylobacter sp.]MDP3056281.1 hypothetical protein [Methylobacter sp.]MDP3361045.1 hypothetical protein [Methylobacter sp.]
MSILDELRQKADQKRADELQQKSIQQNLEGIYKTALLPKMQYFFDCLNETVKHLNFLEEPILINDYCARYPQFGKLLQKNYKINTDGYSGLADYDHLMQINVTFLCEGDGSFSYSLESRSLIEAEVAFLHARRLPFSWKNQSAITGVDTAAFSIQRKVPVSFKIEVDYKQSQLKVTINNHENLEFFSKSFTPEQLDDDFLDTLISYLMRRDNRLVRLDISEEHKIAIQKQLAYQQQEQAALLARIRYEEENAVPDKESFKLANPVKAIFSRYGRKD